MNLQITAPLYWSINQTTSKHNSGHWSVSTTDIRLKGTVPMSGCSLCCSACLLSIGSPNFFVHCFGFYMTIMLIVFWTPFWVSWSVRCCMCMRKPWQQLYLLFCTASAFSCQRGRHKTKDVRLQLPFTVPTYSFSYVLFSWSLRTTLNENDNLTQNQGLVHSSLSTKRKENVLKHGRTIWTYPIRNVVCHAKCFATVCLNEYYPGLLPCAIRRLVTHRSTGWGNIRAKP